MAKRAFEFDGGGNAGVGMWNENGLEVGPIPCAFAFDGFGSDSEKAFEALVDGADGGGGGGVGGGGGGHVVEV